MRQPRIDTLILTGIQSVDKRLTGFNTTATEWLYTKGTKEQYLCSTSRVSDHAHPQLSASSQASVRLDIVRVYNLTWLDY
jgi:hypothetical protein